MQSHCNVARKKPFDYILPATLHNSHTITYEFATSEHVRLRFSKRHFKKILASNFDDFVVFFYFK